MPKKPTAVRKHAAAKPAPAEESRADYEARLTREQAKAAEPGFEMSYVDLANGGPTPEPKKGVSAKPQPSSAAAKKSKAEKRKADEKALREAKAAEDKANAGQPTAQQLAVIADRESKKAVMEATIAQKSAFLESLDPYAKEINHRFELALQLDGKADDHRLAASLKLAEARALCEANHVRFKDWAEQHVKEHNYDYVLRLAKVGAADDPKLALEDMRAKNAEDNRRHRAKHKTVRQRSEVVGATSNIAEFLADKTGDVELEQPAPRKPVTGIDALKHAFAVLKASEQMKFVKWAAEEVGAVLDFNLGDAAEHGSATAQAQFLNQQSA